MAPACLLAYLGAMRARIEEELAWTVNSTLFSAMVKYGDYADHQSAAQERRSTLPNGEAGERVHPCAAAHAISLPWYGPA